MPPRNEQGGHIVGDILGGGGGTFPGQGCTQPTTEPLSPSTSPGSKIVAATFFGDVRHTASQAYNVGTGASGSGIWPRAGSQLSLNQWPQKLHSWCLSGEPVRAGGSDYNAHASYSQIYTAKAAAWVKTKLE
ncbi:Uu.00g037020.m01.CDS01 [Anthostomella pinea]|uniref:Uu.00g037020.m01.CDS01 n=1 Tax=Anthostomella pinea TaxID=933095 RepID=A0AAI8YB72_9PEZI|nr:Uu.00g037020.m01.CDS01 [Anthostomella pinea]